MGQSNRRSAVRAIAVIACVGVSGAVGAGHLAAAANGSRIAFEGDRFSSWGLSAMHPDGTGAVDLFAPLGAADAAWSPNGQQVAFEADQFGDGNLEVFVMNADGTNVRQLTDEPHRDFWPSWFPDGRQLAFTSDRSGVPHIYVMDVDGGEVRALTAGIELGCVEPNVSPNGRTVIFMCSTQFGPPSIWSIGADGSGLTQVTPGGPHQDLSPQFSPNGRRIVFSSNRGGTFEIYVMDAGGANPTQLTASPGADFNPAFSPDGQQIAWWKLRGQGDVWVMNADGSGQTNITRTPNFFEGFPDWHQGQLVVK